MRAGTIGNSAIAAVEQDDFNQTSMEGHTMKRILGALAVLSFLIAAGCSTTQTSAPASQGVVASVSGNAGAAPQCVPGWNACVCAKDSKCCSVRQDCNCSGEGHAYCN